MPLGGVQQGKGPGQTDKKPRVSEEVRKPTALSATESREIDDLMAAIDDDWDAAHRRDKMQVVAESDKMTAQLEQLAAVSGVLCQGCVTGHLCDCYASACFPL